ncbi:MAG: thiamine pyrophosphate-dependent dehydrogenase E1 component subunit alpha [Sulfolobales archaeon]|nr:thiamine pyrophosphate-dependent dehydrogenase E1 component subunit alpha [Sulfolobales archaeon]MCX8198656.1 thiamine pyrophosphate-dependent dehydrogenase E1 component subunit alpha [Sulfolobales archaeon]MDW8169729.1 thiamine pyrophosphate-dependent dehydrogenase E1 component subunit alpha [Desulfurococcaceae archaeon]
MKIDLNFIDTILIGEYEKFSLTKAKLKEMLETMIIIRAFEEKVEALFLKEGILMGPSHLYIGMEAIAAGVRAFIRKGDLIISHHRGHGHAIMIGTELERLFAELLGFKEGNMKGVGGSMHLPIDPERGGLYASAIVGSQIPIAVGVAYAQKLRKTGNITIVFFGDGAVNTGAFAEGVVMSAFLKVPLVLLCENNVYAEFTKTADLFEDDSVVLQRFIGYGIPILVVNGNDPLSVYKGLKTYEEELRSGKGPIAIVAMTYRLKGHGVYDKSPYKPLGEEDLWRSRDPIITFSNRLINEGVVMAGEYEEMLKNTKRKIDEAFERAKRGSPMNIEELYSLV